MGITNCPNGLRSSPITLSVRLADNSTTTATFLTCAPDQYSLALDEGAIIGLACAGSAIFTGLVIIAIVFWNKRAREREIRANDVQIILDKKARQLQGLQDGVAFQHFDAV